MRSEERLGQIERDSSRWQSPYWQEQTKALVAEVRALRAQCDGEPGIDALKADYAKALTILDTLRTERDTRDAMMTDMANAKLELRQRAEQAEAERNQARYDYRQMCEVAVRDFKRAGQAEAALARVTGERDRLQKSIKDVIRWADARRDASTVTTLGMVQEQLRAALAETGDH